MKKMLFLGASCFLLNAMAIAGPVTVSYQATADANIWMLDGGCVLQGSPPPYGSNTPANVNFGTVTESAYMDWTWNGDMGLGPKVGGCPNGTQRTLIKFAQINAIPSCAVITHAQLILHGIPSTAGCSYCWDSWPSSSPGIYSNEGYVKRILNPWNEYSVTWNNFGAPTNGNVTSVGQAAIPATGAAWGWDQIIDVTSLVQDIVNGVPNNGWQLSLQNEVNYRRVMFGSRENPNTALRPELRITYVENGGFEYCTTTNNSAVYTLSALNPLGNMSYSWEVNGIPFSGANVSVDLTSIISNVNFGTDYSITLTETDNNTGAQCVKYQDLCQTTGGNNGTTCAAFSVCRNSTDPNTFNLTALNPAPTGYMFSWIGLGGTGATVTYPNGINGNAAVVSFSGPPSPSPFQTNATLSVIPVGGGANICSASLKMCYVYNTAKPARNDDAPYDPSVPQYSTMAPPDNVLTSKLTISPNPTTSDWNVNFVNSNEDGKAIINLFDVTGKFISSQTSNLIPGMNIITISTKNIEPGIYILELKKGNASYKEKVIKTK